MRNEPASKLKSDYFDYIAEDLINCEGLDGVQYVLDSLLSKYGFDNYVIFERDRYSKTPDHFSVLISNTDLNIDQQNAGQTVAGQTNVNRSASELPIYNYANQFVDFVKSTTSPMHCPFVWIPDTSSENRENSAEDTDASEKLQQPPFRAVVIQCNPDKLKDYFFFFYGTHRVTSHSELAEIGYLAQLTSDLLAAEHAQNLRKNLTLGNRERQCLSWTAQGKTSFEISKILGLSEHTVNNYVVSATRKLGASNRAHAIAKALRLELI